MRECELVWLPWLVYCYTRELYGCVYVFITHAHSVPHISVEQNIIQNHMCHVLVFNTFVFIFSVLFRSHWTPLSLFGCTIKAVKWNKKRILNWIQSKKKPNRSWWNHIYRRKNCKWIKALSSEKTRELMNYKCERVWATVYVRVWLSASGKVVMIIEYN